MTYHCWRNWESYSEYHYPSPVLRPQRPQKHDLDLWSSHRIRYQPYQSILSYLTCLCILSVENFGWRRKCRFCYFSIVFRLVSGPPTVICRVFGGQNGPRRPTYSQYGQFWIFQGQNLGFWCYFRAVGCRNCKFKARVMADF